MPRTLNFDEILSQEQLAGAIADKYMEWENRRVTAVSRWRELREYIFATDTRGTTNSVLPWKNSVHIPKLCQIRDNLHANYMAALFPNDTPIRWEGDDESSETLKKRTVIEGYINNKLRMSQFRTEISKAVFDFIDYGNVFGTTEYVAEWTEDPQTKEKIIGYCGPRLRRMSPLDIVFDPTAATFEEAPKIIRSIKTIGSLRADMEDHPEMNYLESAWDKFTGVRKAFSGTSASDYEKNVAFQMDGFDSWLNYFTSDYVEVLEFYGDLYDNESGELLRNHVITIIDRAHVIRKTPQPSWLGRAPIFHCGWRLRPDNLWAMGPLDNLVGMQYRIDHLENAKADAFDLIVQPVMKVKGIVEDFDYGPNERIYVGDDGDVEFMAPDVTMLNADTQIAIYEQKMEEMAGAPKQAMGFRTPGEKTAYEVQVLENGANRIFLNKASYFEEVFIEPIINSMLEISRRNIGTSDLIRVVDDQYGAVEFMKITKEDITAKGKIRPIGARHFARNANILQNLTQFSASPLGQDPAVMVHFSGKRLAEVVQELLQLEKYELVQENIRIIEQAETQKLAQAAQQIVAEQGMPDNAQPMVQAPTQGGTGGA